MALPTFSSSKFGWTGKSATSYKSELGIKEFPRQGFFIKSERSGETRMFLPDNANMEANEFYDGEAYAYFVPGGNLTAKIWC
jgi:hypothetical protein